ncbi:ABC transporter permease, partial [Streptomyces sp. NEAU-W12]|nr:ABC transporter permease [Streptomyces sp. NEAU-W12]
MSETTHDGPVTVSAPVPPDDGLTAAELAAKYGLTVSGARPSLVEYVRLLWGRRHFILTFSRAKLTAQYSQARLGQLWQVATPLLNAAVYFFIFGLLLGAR